MSKFLAVSFQAIRAALPLEFIYPARAKRRDWELGILLAVGTLPQADFIGSIRAAWNWDYFRMADDPGAIREAPLFISSALRGQSEAVVSR
jgi:hypothetical protein